MKDKKFYVIYEEFQDYNGYWDMICDKHETLEEAEAKAEILKSNSQLYMNIKILTDI
jgi:hypothetical protein